MLRRLKRKLEDIRFNRKMAKQRYKKGYADCDVWGMHYWFSSTFPKMLRDLSNMKHGAPELNFEEIENYPIDWLENVITSIEENNKKKNYGADFDLYSIFDRWQIILHRIAWCLEQCSDDVTEIENEFEEEYNRQVWGDAINDFRIKSFKEYWNDITEVVERDEKGNPKMYRLKTKEADEEIKEKYFNRIKEISKYREERKDEAFDLLKKYFYHLWD